MLGRKIDNALSIESIANCAMVGDRSILWVGKDNQLFFSIANFVTVKGIYNCLEFKSIGR